MNFLWLSVLVFQVPFVLILLRRLSTAPSRIPALVPVEDGSISSAKVTIVIPTLNERLRLPYCLEGLRSQQGVHEIIIVDSRSQDGTPEYVKEIQENYPIKLRLITDDPLPQGWVGRPWALHTGFLNSDPDSEWILGIDADTQPQVGLVQSLVQKAIAENYDMVSLSPKFILKTIGEQWLQPALLVTLIFRFGATGDRQQFSQERIMANGQCFLSRRAILEKIQGYELAKSSFCDDVTLVRSAAQQGAKVGFLDGANLIQVRMYTSMAETWTEWGRSLDLKDATTSIQTLGDCLLLFAVQCLPIPLFLGLILGLVYFDLELNIFTQSLLWLNGFLVLIRFLLVGGIRSSYTELGFMFWLSPFADPVAVLRIWLSALTKPKQWRGRVYGNS
ncbi:glycosyl transferase [Synechococcus sp. PCC 7502]|uniref:glycosyltransferase n=1 Tax=Synechococcus sp. PCC 7502 TaxID=1173263 RepID=UPI00029FE423|nr:glycosyltransferase family 2 protein [Synechococcus sp. PCC 7502]AFY73252.1 glycosyl transferase [Synechococcus sp. PCC 7502]